MASLSVHRWTWNGRLRRGIRIIIITIFNFDGCIICSSCRLLLIFMTTFTILVRGVWGAGVLLYTYRQVYFFFFFLCIIFLILLLLYAYDSCTGSYYFDIPQQVLRPETADHLRRINGTSHYRYIIPDTRIIITYNIIHYNTYLYVDDGRARV